jgi:hypothetical protein
MAAGVATSRHYVGHSLSCLAAVLAFPDINGSLSEDSDPFWTCSENRICFGLPLGFTRFLSLPSRCRPLARPCGSARSGPPGAAREISLVALRAFSRRQLKGLTSERVAPAQSGARALWITRITGAILAGHPPDFSRTARGEAVSDPQEPRPSSPRPPAFRGCRRRDRGGPW